MSLKEIEQLLNEKIPRDVVSERDGGGGRKLSYLEGWYVIDRLNQIFGPLGWSKEVTDVRQVVNTTSRGEFPAYLVKVRLEIRVSRAEVPYVESIIKEAYGYGADKSGQNAHELAIKEAVTDALKVAAKDLGMSLGLALYDKSQEFVDDGPETKTETRFDQPRSEVRNSSLTPKVENGPAAPAKAEAQSREKIIKEIESYIRVAKAQKRLSYKDYFEKLGVSVLSDINKLTDEQLSQSINQMKELTK